MHSEKHCRDKHSLSQAQTYSIEIIKIILLSLAGAKIMGETVNAIFTTFIKYFQNVD